MASPFTAPGRMRQTKVLNAANNLGDLSLKKSITAASVMTAMLFSFSSYAQDIPETITVTSSAFDHHGMVPILAWSPD